MKTIIAAFLLLTSACFGQAIASRRYAEKTPLQYAFGSFTAVAPYNEAAGYSVVPTTAQLQPSNLIYGSSSFGSASDFTELNTSGSCAFTVESNVGTVNCAGAQSVNLSLNSASIPIPSIFVSMDVVQNSTGGSEQNDNSAVCLFKDANNSICAYVDKGNGTSGIWLTVGGSGANIIGSFSFAIPAAPWKLGLSLTSNEACIWVNSGTGWTPTQCGNTNIRYDFTLDGNLTGWHPGFQFYTSANPSILKVSNFAAGALGGVGVRDMTLVTKPDGTPYMQGSTAYFTASTTGGCSLFSYDVISGTLTEISTIWADTGTGKAATGPDHLIYDPQSELYRLWMSGFAINQFPPYLYATFLKSIIDPLQPGVHVVSGYSTISLPGGPNGPNGWDENAACSQWNYSTGTCSKWLVCYVIQTTTTWYPACASTPSEPSNSSVWTLIGTDSVSTHYEGSRILRTATGTLGVNYNSVFGGITGSSTRATRVYDTSEFTYLGALNAPLPAGSTNAPHPQIFSYGNTEYFVTFNDNSFSTIIPGDQMGNWLVATAPKY